MIVLAIAVGGAVGSVLRWWLGRLNGSVPWGTLTANTLGSALLAYLVWSPGLGVLADPVGTVGWPAFVGLGLLGGLTTFSTLAVEVTQPRRPAWGYLGLTLVVTLPLAYVLIHASWQAFT